MRFQIEHRTAYHYAGTASESFMEARLTPVTDDRQRLISRRLQVDPVCNIHAYTDYFGNHVETFSIVHRHQELILTSTSVVETVPLEVPRAAVDITVAEAQQLYRADKLKLFEYVATSGAIERTTELEELSRSFFPPGMPLGQALLELNGWISQRLTYQPGSTQIDTPVTTVLRTGAGVCQDFAQLLIALLRPSQIPARYVTGYIETDAQRDAASGSGEQHLIGASESHAWVEAYLPGGFWWPLDPTNRTLAGERHVKVAAGRDYHDCTPTRGVFKGTTSDQLKASVSMRRT